ncbi:MAG: DUF2339 domain-containing protein [Methyloglobulus sp.]|nr:DUF2339 domain-containing protein [Methyloglobulus sp.]
MQQLFGLMGLVGLFASIGGLLSFVSLFRKKPDDEERFRLIAKDLGILKKRFDAIEKGQLLQTKPPFMQADSLDSATSSADAMAEIEKQISALTNEFLKFKERLDIFEKTSPTDVDETLEIIVTPLTVDRSEQVVMEPPKPASRPNDEWLQPPLSARTLEEKPFHPEILEIPSTQSPIQPTLQGRFDGPNFIDKGFTFAKDWLLGGNTLVRSGIVILFIGISFLLKYAAEHSHVPIELRLAAIVFFGLGLLVLGWRLRDKRPEYSWALQGGGIGVLYLTIFAALKLYQLIPAGAAFGLLIAVAFLSASIAVLQSAMSLAVLGFAGGFLAPIFTATGQGSHVNLFSYYLVLNLAIAFIAYYRSWRPLNVLGFAFTFIIGTVWGAKNYQPEHFASTEPFLVIHFLLFTAIAVLYAHRQATKVSDYVDATLVFGTPIVGFSLQYALLRDSHFGLAYSALALGVFYIGLAWWVLTRKRDTLEFLGECFLALGVGFATLTLPLALDGRWTSAAWAVEGVGLIWVGLRQQRALPLLAGLVLQLFGAGAFVQGWGLTGFSEVAHQNMFLGVSFIALSGWACGALLNAYRSDEKPILTTLFSFWGWAWWVGAGLTAIDQFLPSPLFVHAGLVFVAMTSLALPPIAKILKWRQLSNLSALLLPVIVVAMLPDIFQYHPFANYGGLSWLIAFAAYLWLLAREKIPNGAILRAPLLWAAAIIGVMEWKCQLSSYINESNVWRDIGWAIAPAIIVVMTLYWHRRKAMSSPGKEQSTHDWLWVGCAPIMLFLVAWFVFESLSSSGNAAPLAYFPLLNPLDIALAAILLLLLIWHRELNQFTITLPDSIPIVAGLMGFALLNGMLLRTLHHWIGTPFEWLAIFTYPQVQMAFTFLWGITAFILMLLAHRRVQRKMWIVGAVLMGLVVAKIFLLDLAQHGSVERIISFIGAGVMLLVMGYFAPLPPSSLGSTDSIEEGMLE